MITLGRDVCRDLGAALSHEWLVTNGLGGYASGTLPGVNTRRYHGLLIAALQPPAVRTQLLANCDEEVEMDAVTYFLGANEYQDERIHPGGFVHLESFTLDHAMPSFLYRVGPSFLEKTVWMEYGRNTTYIRYIVKDSPYPMTLILRPFVNYRSHHDLTKGKLDWSFDVTTLPIGGGCAIKAVPDATPYYLIASPRAAFTPSGVWYWNFLYRLERERGMPYLEDLYLPGVFRSRLAVGESLTLIASAEPPSSVDRNAEAAFTRARARQEQLLRRAGVLPSADGADSSNPALADGGQAFLAQLVQAADQFIVRRGGIEQRVAPAPAKQPTAFTYTRAPNAPQLRTSPAGAMPSAPPPPPASEPNSLEPDSSRTVIAGYPWFAAWGRDTMISLPGLALGTGRLAAVEDILRAFAGYISEGMVPNLFPDEGTEPEYNTVDATLWYFHAIEAYLRAGGSPDLVRDLWPQLEEIIHFHVEGTRYGIRVDPADGLLCAGEPGAQLTWMDAKYAGTVFTPRHGKPVEIQALWYHALRIMDRLSVEDGGMGIAGGGRETGDDTHAVRTADYAAMADRALASFGERFWYAEGGYFYDAVDGPEGDDASLRPNQLFALSLEPDLVTEQQAKSVLQIVREQLLTPFGLRSLAPSDPRYSGTYSGDQANRDSVYHQGTVWPWLLGAYGDAARLWEGLDREGLRRLLDPLQKQLAVDCAGTINEIYEGAEPFRPKGCFAQAWSVAEVLRLLRAEWPLA